VWDLGVPFDLYALVLDVAIPAPIGLRLLEMFVSLADQCSRNNNSPYAHYAPIVKKFNYTSIFAAADAWSKNCQHDPQRFTNGIANQRTLFLSTPLATSYLV
jgi:hypothetical protein